MDKVRAKRIAAELRGQSVGGWMVGDYIGNGASAVVVAAERAGQVAAVKIIDPEFVERYGAPQQLARVQRECDLIGHAERHLVQLFDGGQCRDSGYLYIAMELLAHPQLTTLVPTFPRERIAPIIGQLALAAQFLEARGLAHRDIKSDNIAISRDCENAILLDLGVIRPIADPARVDAGSGAEFLGTTRYSPPEYLLREEEDSVDGWRAVTFYQLGAVLHDLIMRKRMFDDVSAPYAKLIEAVRSSRPIIDAPDVPPHLVTLARGCLQKNWRLRLELVKWEHFHESAPPVSGAEAKDRIRKRLASVETSANTLIPGATIPRRRILENIGGSVSNAAREICLQAGTFPPVEVTHSDTPDGRFVLIRTGPSEQHLLSGSLSIKFACTLVDDVGLFMRVRAVAGFGDLPPTIPTDAWSGVYIGDASSANLRDRLDDFLHLALDAAQDSPLTTPGSLLQIPSLD
jgi:serine/threonine protein kinase